MPNGLQLSANHSPGRQVLTLDALEVGVSIVADRTRALGLVVVGRAGGQRRARAGGADGHAGAAARLAALVFSAVVVDAASDVDASQQRVALGARRTVALGSVARDAALGAPAARGRLTRVAAVLRDAGAVERTVVVARALGCRRRDVEDGVSACGRRRRSVSRWLAWGQRSSHAQRRRQARAAGGGSRRTHLGGEQSGRPVGKR